MEALPIYIPTLFILLTLIAIYLLYKAANENRLVLNVALVWLALQGIISSKGFYLVTDGMPPRFMLLALPPVVLIAVLHITARGRLFIDQTNAKWLTGLHTIRIFVELGLFSLYLHHYIPRIMTFEGYNLDVLSGLSAPVILYCGYYKNWLGKKVLLLWNFICLALLINIVVTAILSAPFKFQQFGLEQPNIAILRFPFVWLPGFIVPVVLFAHLASIRQLLKGR